MKRYTLGMSFAFFAAVLFATAMAQDDLLTVTEKNDFRITSNYEETTDFFTRLAQASPYAKLTVMGRTPERRNLHCLIVSKDKAFTPEAAKRTGKIILLIQNGIHAGEIDGKDACMILLREILITKERESLLDSVILLVIPIFNLDGHENTERYTRSNQIGPENAGFRVTAQRYNLNRDYVKADAPEMQAWLRLWHTWLPDFFVDDHVTDGHDWQHAVNYSMPWHPNAAQSIRDWTNRVFDPYFIPRCTDLGYPPVPYAFPLRNRADGAIGTFVEGPRLSTGYTALWNRPGLLVEMHSLKDYKTRVLGNHAALVAVLEVLNRNASSLRAAIKTADAATLSGAEQQVPLSFEPSGDSTFMRILSYEQTTDSSKVTGGRFPKWNHARTTDDTVPYFGSFRAKETVSIPRAYLIPCEWADIAERLSWHGVRIDTLTAPAKLPVQIYRLDSVKFADDSYEGHVRVTYQATAHDTMLTYPAGTYVVDTRQLPGKVAVWTLEPEAGDSYLSWGFLNTVLEQKEYVEDYIIDPLADSLYANDPAIRAEFDAKVAADTAFARRIGAKRDFFYKRSRYAEGGLDWYPITRLRGELPKSAPWRNER